MPQPAKHKSPAARQAAYRRRQEAARQELVRQKGLPPVQALPHMPGTARWNAARAWALALLEQTSAEMSEYFDDRTEVWQESDRGQQHQEHIDAIESIIAELEALA